jgi:RNA polymerase II-associated factor 1
VSTKTPKPSVSWLRRTEYISGEYSKVIVGKENLESRMGLNMAPGDEDYKTRDEHIRAIEEGFDAAKHISGHPTKPQLTAVNIVPVFPDQRLWMNQYTLCTFDDDPTMLKDNIPTNSVNRALMKPMKNPDDAEDRFVLYFLPTEPTPDNQELAIVHSEKKENPDIYECVKEYAIELKLEKTRHQYFFVQRQDGIYYDELNSKLMLHKRRAKTKNARECFYERPSFLYVSQREPMPEEIELQQVRLKDLS